MRNSPGRYLLTFILMLFFGALPAAGAEQDRLFISFDLIESPDTAWFKNEILSTIPSLLRRNTSDKFRYLAGGDFSVPPFTEESFFVRHSESNLEIKIAWQPVQDEPETAKVRYSARMSYPGQQNFAQVEKSVKVTMGKAMFISENDTPQGTQDTKPLWVILRAETRKPQYAFSLQGGIGAKLQIKQGYPYILELVPYGPAHNAGLEQGDEIQEVNGYSTLQLALDQIMRLLRGDPGTEVRVKIRKVHGNAIEDKKIIRDHLKDNTELR